jgi:arsenate reductase-like glutaredoxin family protein
MTQTTFKIKKAFLIPFIIIVVLTFLLFLSSLFKGQMLEKFILAISFVITLFIAVESMKRKITVTNNGLKIEKFFRTKEFTWAELTQLGVVILRNKVYFILTTIKGFYFFSNLIENHALLIRAIVDKLDNERVEIEIKNYLENPVEQSSLIVMCWFGVVIITAFIILKLLSF